MIKKITDETKQLLQNATCTHILRVDKMDDELYNNTRFAIESLGGKWSQKHEGFLFFKDPTEKLNNLLQTGEYEMTDEHRTKHEKQFYPTPVSLITEMICLAQLTTEDVVLEPSAGTGSIVGELLSTAKSVVAIEPDHDNYRALSRGIAQMYNSEKCECYEMTFEEYAEIARYDPLIAHYFDKVIMNPPFSSYRDGLHIMKAFELLKDNGILVSVCSENILYYDHPIAKQFRKFLNDNEAEIIPVKDGTFLESGTSVTTVLVKLVK